MNNYILIISTITLIIGGLFVYKLFGYCLASPTFISYMIFSLGTLIAYFGNKSWNMNISWSIFFVLFISILSMAFGEYIVRTIYQRRKRELNSYYNYQEKRKYKVIYNIPFKMIIFFVLLGIIADILYYIRLCQIAHVGYADFIGMLSKINLARHNTNERMGVHIACLNVIQSTAWGCFTIAYINNVVLLGKKGIKRYRSYLLLWPGYIMSVLIGGSRIFFISIISYVCFAFILLRKRYFGKRSDNKRTVRSLAKVMSLLLVALFFFFSFMGQLSGKINDRLSGFESFMIYASSSLVDLNIYLDNGIIRSTLPGAITFSGLFNTLSRFIAMPSNNDVGLGYILLGNGTLTNVYTAFAAYLVDFGWIGLIVLQMLLGILYTCIFIYLEESKLVSLAVFTYFNFLLYGLVGQLFAAETFAGLLTVNDIFGLFLYCLIFIFIEPKITYIVQSQTRKEV